MTDVVSAWAQFDQLRAQPEPTEFPVYRYDSHTTCECGEYRQFVYDEFNGFTLASDLPVCQNCGRCDDSYVSDEPEWNGGMGDDGEVSDPSRVGAPTNTDHFSAGWNLGCNMQVHKQTRMSVMNFYLSVNHKDRALYLAYQEMEHLNRMHLGLPDNIMYDAKMKYKKFVEAVLCRGTVRAAIKAHCVFQACKEAGVNRTSREIADAFGIQERDISRTTDMYKEQNPDAHEVGMTMPKDLVARFFNSVEMEDKGRAKMKCVNACVKVENCIKLQGRTPKAVAATVIFVVLSGQLTKKQVCEICDVSLPTLSKLEPIVRAELDK